MKPAIPSLSLAGAALSLLVSCSSSSSKGDHRGDASAVFTVESCKAETCGNEAQVCNWTTSNEKYRGCLTDCENLGTISTVCPKEAQAIYACADLGANVDCTTGKGTGCEVELQNLTACLQGADGGR